MKKLLLVAEWTSRDVPEPLHEPRDGRHDSVRLARSAGMAGVDVTLYIGAGMQHIFPIYCGMIPEADAAVAMIGTFIKELSWTGISIDRISEGKIVESWANWDMMGMMQQLGVVHTPGESEEASLT